MDKRQDILHDAIADVIESDVIRARYTNMEDICSDLELIAKELRQVALRITARSHERDIKQELDDNFSMLRRGCNS